MSYVKMSYPDWLKMKTTKERILFLFLNMLYLETDGHPAWRDVNPEMNYRYRYNKIRPHLEELKELVWTRRVEREMNR
jgi:hypothetical protein